MSATKTTIRKGSAVRVVRAVRGAEVGATGKVERIGALERGSDAKVFWVRMADGIVVDLHDGELERA